MALRIGESVLRGEIRNSKRNTVSGWMELDPAAVINGEAREPQDLLLLLELTGNLQGDLARRNFRFEVPRLDAALVERFVSDKFIMRQVGVVGDSSLQMARIPLVSAAEFLDHKMAGMDPPEAELPCLRLQWFGQNGCVKLELVNPKIEYEGSYDELADPDPEPDTEPPADEAGAISIPGMEINDGAYGLFPDDFDEQIRQSAAVDDVDDGVPCDSRPEQAKPRDWEEVIPGISPETKAMYEQWDEVVDGVKDEPLTWLFQESLQLPTPAQVADEEQAWRVLQLLLSEMAMRGVAFHMCEHYTAKQAYRLLIEEILPRAHVHPNLVATGFTQNYMTHEFCAECEAEI